MAMALLRCCFPGCFILCLHLLLLLRTLSLDPEEKTARPRGWWWGYPSANLSRSRLLDPALLHAGAKRGERYVPRCYPGREGFRRPNDYIARAPTHQEIPVSTCPNGKPSTDEWQQIQGHMAEMGRERDEIAATTTTGKLAAAPLPPQGTLRFEHSGECRKKGLTHQLANLEFELQLARYFGWTLEMEPLWESLAHTHCNPTRMAAEGFAVSVASTSTASAITKKQLPMVFRSSSWATLVNLSGLPATTEAPTYQRSSSSPLSTISEEFLISNAISLRTVRHSLEVHCQSRRETHCNGGSLTIRASAADFPWW
jgi:hypothetical protein